MQRLSPLASQAPRLPNALQTVSLALALSLSACLTEPGNPDEDYSQREIDGQAVGGSVIRAFSQAQDWDAATSAPAAGISITEFSPGLGALQKGGALAKTAGSIFLPDGTELDFNDTADGRLIGRKATQGLLQTTTDVAVIRWDEQAKDEVPDNENAIAFTRIVAWNNGDIEEVSIEDADGDGLINAKPGQVSKVRLTFSQEKGGVTESAILVADAGADADFDTEEDNALYSGQWTRKLGDSLLASAEYADADGDGKVVNPALESSLVDVFLIDSKPEGKPWVERQEAEIRLRVLGRKGGEIPVSFHFTEFLKNGRENEVSLLNGQGGDEIIAGDTLHVIVETRKTREDDTLRSARLEFVMNPGSDLESEEDDVLYAFHAAIESRFGFERAAEFHFSAAEPVPHGEEPRAGSFTGRVTYANGQSAEVSGSFAPEGFEVEFIGPDGNRVKLEMNATGSIAAAP